VPSWGIKEIWALDLKFRLLQILVHIPVGFGQVSLRGRARTVFMDWQVADSGEAHITGSLK